MSQELPFTVYSAESALASPGKMLREMLRDFSAGRGLAWRLALRDIKAQYRQAYLGVLWAFIMPLANTVVWVFLSSSGIIRVSDTALPYPVYVFTGTMLWAIFMDALNAPLQQSNAAKGMLAKLNFPREALILSGVYQTLFNAGIKVSLLLGALVIMGINPGWGILMFPVALMSLVLVGTALGLMITPVGLLYSDVGRAMPLLMQFLMYLTPVLFPIPKGGWAAGLVTLNPLTPLIVTARDWLTGTSPQLLTYFVFVNLFAAVLLMAALAVYRLAMPVLVERMSS